MMFQRSDDRFLAEIRSRLYVSVVSDVLDALGRTEQAMAARIRPLDDSLVLVGYARTGVYNDVYHVAKGENPYELGNFADRRHFPQRSASGFASAASSSRPARVAG